MALKKSKSRKCPVCVGHTIEKVKEVDLALAPLLADVKATGEIPKAKDKRLKEVSFLVGLAPHSLQFHLKSCLVDMEIQDQRFQELKDMTDLLSTAKAEYLANPSMNTATAVNQLMTQWRGLAEDIEGQTDPSLTVEFMVETVLAPMNRQLLSSMARELRDLRESLQGLLPRNQHPFIDSQVKSVMSRMASALRDSTDDSLKTICSFYKVELEAQQRVRAMDSTTPEEQEEEAAVAH